MCRRPARGTICLPARPARSRQRRDDIAAAIRDHQVVIVAGETGSGKTTQLPKICLELGRGGADGGLIGHTQPRRIAARSVAERIAEELGTELGDLVGYQVRFTDRTSKPQPGQADDRRHPAGRARSATAMLRKYDTIIIDEAHERQPQHRLPARLPQAAAARRPDLKVIITSATIDPERFAEHFADDAGRRADHRGLRPDVPGRGPLPPAHRAPEDDEEGEAVVRDQTEAIVDAVARAVRRGAGDILVFLPGEREIRDTADALAATSSADAARGRAALLAALRRRAAPGLRSHTRAAASCSPPTSPRRR